MFFMLLVLLLPTFCSKRVSGRLIAGGPMGGNSADLRTVPSALSAFRFRPRGSDDRVPSGAHRAHRAVRLPPWPPVPERRLALTSRSSHRWTHTKRERAS